MWSSPTTPPHRHTSIGYPPTAVRCPLTAVGWPPTDELAFSEAGFPPPPPLPQ